MFEVIKAFRADGVLFEAGSRLTKSDIPLDHLECALRNGLAIEVKETPKVKKNTKPPAGEPTE